MSLWFLCWISQETSVWSDCENVNTLAIFNAYYIDQRARHRTFDRLLNQKYFLINYVSYLVWREKEPCSSLGRVSASESEKSGIAVSRNDWSQSKIIIPHKPSHVLLLSIILTNHCNISLMIIHTSCVWRMQLWWKDAVQKMRKISNFFAPQPSTADAWVKQNLCESSLKKYYNALQWFGKITLTNTWVCLLWDMIFAPEPSTANACIKRNLSEWAFR